MNSDTGNIQFDSNPSGTIIKIDNKEIGNTPIEIANANPGTYHYSLTTGKKKHLGLLTVHPNQITHITIDFFTVKEGKYSVTEEYIKMNISKETGKETTIQEDKKSKEQTDKKTEKKSKPENEDKVKSKDDKVKSKDNEQESSETEEETYVKGEENKTELEYPIEKVPESVPEDGNSASEHKILADHLEQMNKILLAFENTLEIVKEYIGREAKFETTRKYYNTELLAISIATPNKPFNSDDIADTSIPRTGYDRILVHDIKNPPQNAAELTFINDGTDAIFVISSINGKNFDSSENVIFPGEARTFYNIYELRARSPTAGNLTMRSGGVYRVTEYAHFPFLAKSTRGVTRSLFFQATLGNHFGTLQGTYTVPANKRAQITLSLCHLRISTASSAPNLKLAEIDVIPISTGISTTVQIAAMGSDLNIVGQTATTNIGLNALLEAGDIVELFTRNDCPDGTVKFILNAVISEYDA